MKRKLWYLRSSIGADELTKATINSEDLVESTAQIGVQFENGTHLYVDAFDLACVLFPEGGEE